MKTHYKAVTRNTPYLACFQSEDGKGINREYLILLDPHTMQEVNLKNNTCRVYQSKGELNEYDAWVHGCLEEIGYTEVPFANYLLAQNKLDGRLKPAKPVQVKVKATRFGTTWLTQGTVTV